MSTISMNLLSHFLRVSYKLDNNNLKIKMDFGVEQNKIIFIFPKMAYFTKWFGQKLLIILVESNNECTKFNSEHCY